MIEFIKAAAHAALINGIIAQIHNHIVIVKIISVCFNEVRQIRTGVILASPVQGHFLSGDSSVLHSKKSKVSHHYQSQEWT